MTPAVGVPENYVDQIDEEPDWAPTLAVAYTIAYGAQVMGDTMSRKPLADESRHRITVSTFVLDDASKSWVHTGVQDLVRPLSITPIARTPDRGGRTGHLDQVFHLAALAANGGLVLDCCHPLRHHRHGADPAGQKSQCDNDAHLAPWKGKLIPVDDHPAHAHTGG